MSGSEEELPVPPAGRWLCMGEDSDDELCGNFVKDKKPSCSDCGTSSKCVKIVIFCGKDMMKICE